MFDFVYLCLIQNYCPMNSKILLLFSIVGAIIFTACKKDEDEETPSKTVSELVSEGKTVQQILDEGKTPYEVYQHNNEWLDTLYGLTYQGGLIYYLDVATGAGYVVLDSNIGGKPSWGCYGTSISGAGGTTIGDGQQNTTDILAGCSSANTAADVCNDLVYGGYSDWFLPSYASLQKMNTNLHADGLGDFGSIYWSSNKYTSNNAYGFNFNDGTTSNYTKISTLYVRAVRKF